MRRSPRLLLLAGAGVLLLDQLSKLAADRWLPYGRPLALLPGLALNYVHNPGAAFSLLAGLPPGLRIPLFAGVALAALAAVALYWRALPAPDRWTEAALGLVAGGALGNLIDRLRLGVVLDFIEVGVRGAFTWPVFNVADSAVTVGVGILIWQALFLPAPPPAPPPPSAPPA